MLANQFVVANLILVPSDSETVPSGGQPFWLPPSGAAPVTVTPDAGRANKAVRSMSGGPDQDVIVAPCMRRGRVSGSSTSNAYRSCLADLVLLIFRIADSVP